MTPLRALRLIGSISVFTLEMATPRSALAADPTTPECLEANESSITNRKAHKLKDTRAQLLVCASASCPTEVREECTRRLQEVTAAIPTIVLVVKKAGGAEVVDAVVTMDGQPFATRVDGIAVEVDPGEHMFTFDVQGLPKENRRLVLREGEKNRREDILLGPRAAPSTTPTTPTTTPTTPPAPGDQPKAEAVPFRTVGLIAAGVGVAALAVGSVLGVVAASQKDAAGCTDNVCDDNAQAAKHKDAIGTASIATGFFVAGGILTAGGLAMFLFAPSPSPSTAPAPPPASKGWNIKLANGGGSLGYTGTW